MPLTNLHITDAQLAVDAAVADSKYKRQLEEAEPGSQFWYCQGIAPASLGQYQLQRILEEFDEWEQSYWTDCSLEEIIFGVDDLARRVTDNLRGVVKTPPGTKLIVGYWNNGGCFGYILIKE
jgi:hypothetical protein